MMKAIVCGGRDFSDSEYLESCLDKCRVWWGLTHIIHGGARGADDLAHRWAKSRGLVVYRMVAHWDLHGKAAGILRNREMLQQEPQIVIAFKGGAGTENMITISRQAGVPVLIL